MKTLTELFSKKFHPLALSILGLGLIINAAFIFYLESYRQQQDVASSFIQQHLTPKASP